ncbi:MAG: hypothetical protein LBF74_01840 [Treponema sp.]|jgi:hypothetical protein|nr:hypothetical protein [Treponema sp.]
MKKNVFLMGIVSITMIFALAFTGCGDGAGGGGGGDDNGNGGGGGNPLLGTWANDLDVTNIDTILVFTESASTVAENTKLAYYAANLAQSTYATRGNDFVITIDNVEYTTDISAAGSGTITLADYIPVAGNTPAEDVTFRRAAGTSGSGVRGIWISDLASTHAQYTLLLIGDSVSKRVLWATGNNVAAPNYRLSEVDGITYISWNGGAITAYAKNSVANNVTIPPPGGGNAIVLMPFSSTPTF